jgi:hypothetical protein
MFFSQDFAVLLIITELFQNVYILYQYPMICYLITEDLCIHQFTDFFSQARLCSAVPGKRKPAGPRKRRPDGDLKTMLCFNTILSGTIYSAVP